MSAPPPVRPSAPAFGSPFRAHDRRFREVLGDRPRLVEVVATDAHEGPVYAADEDALYFTSLPRRRRTPAPGVPEVAIRRVALDGTRFPVAPESVTTVRSPANAANGMAMDAAGRLVVCEQGTPTERARVSLLDRRTGEVETLVDAWGGLPLNSPNDVVVAGDGAVWFTDPSYGFLQGFRPRPEAGDHVYRYDPSRGRLAVVADGLDKPNGLAFSPDEGVLYVTDSGANQEPGSLHVGRPHHVVAFDVRDGRHLAAERLLAVTTPGVPDGVAVDREGRVYASACSGVQVFSPEGDLIGEIDLPGAVNFTFGGPDRDALFITADDGLWAALLGARGAEPTTATPTMPPKGA